MTSSKELANHPLLESIFHCNINDTKSRKSLTFKNFFREIAKRPLSALVLTCTTFGIYPWALYRKTQRTLKNALAARKINHYHDLLKQIETLRQSLQSESPKRDIRRLYKQILHSPVENHKTLEFRYIYSSSDIYLFITSPPQDEMTTAHIENLIKMNSDFIFVWHAIKKASRTPELEYIRKINRHYAELTHHHHLSEDQILGKLRASLEENPTELTKLKNLALAFSRIVDSLKEEAS